MNIEHNRSGGRSRADSDTSTGGLFEGFDFQPFVKKSDVSFSLSPIEHTKPTKREDTLIDFRDLFLDQPSIPDIVPNWNPEQLHQQFLQNLQMLSEKIGQGLPIEDRYISFVPREEMRPETKEEQLALINTYGEYIKDGGVGDCARNDDGTFTIRIGYLGEETTTVEDAVIDTLAHEYGHTLGERLPSSIDEELKAYAFTNLFMRHFFEGIYLMEPVEVSGVHEESLHRLNQLTNAGIPSEAILAQLIGESFGKYNPEAYRKYVKND